MILQMPEVASAIASNDSMRLAEAIAHACDGHEPAYADDAWLDMMVARVDFTDYFLTVRTNLLELEGYLPEPGPSSNGAVLINFAERTEDFADGTEQEYSEVSQGPIDNSSDSFKETKLYKALIENDETAKKVMQLVMSGDYYGLDTSGQVRTASRAKVLAIEKHMFGATEAIRRHQTDLAVAEDIGAYQEVLGVVSHAIQDSHVEIEQALAGLFPDSSARNEGADNDN